MKRKKATPPKGDPNWARKTVDAMTPEEVRHWCERLGVKVPPDTRSPIERLVDDATGVRKLSRRAAKPARRT